MKRIIILLLAIILFSCGKDDQKVFDKPFIHIMDNNSSTATVNYQAEVIRTYTVYLSSRPLSDNLEVDFEIVTGSSLKEGIDFEVLTKERTLVFLPGIYDMPIRIRWMPSPAFNSSGDNTVIIRLLKNNKDFTMGLPGPDAVQREFKITKIK